MTAGLVAQNPVHWPRVGTAINIMGAPTINLRVAGVKFGQACRKRYGSIAEFDDLLQPGGVYALINFEGQVLYVGYSSAKVSSRIRTHMTPKSLVGRRLLQMESPIDRVFAWRSDNPQHHESLLLSQIHPPANIDILVGVGVLAALVRDITADPDGFRPPCTCIIFDARTPKNKIIMESLIEYLTTTFRLNGQWPNVKWAQETLVIRHKISSGQAWRACYQVDLDVRRALGASNVTVFERPTQHKCQFANKRKH